jgi:hypothetical protein
MHSEVKRLFDADALSPPRRVSLGLCFVYIHNLYSLRIPKVILIGMNFIDSCPYCEDPDCIGNCQPSSGGLLVGIGLAGTLLVVLALVIRWLFGLG